MTGDIEERAQRLPTVESMVTELRRKPREEAIQLLQTWVEKAIQVGHRAGLTEGLQRASTPVLRSSIKELLERRAERLRRTGLLHRRQP